MTEFRDTPDRDPTQELSQAVASVGMDIVRARDFLGQKAAREFLDQFGFSESIDADDEVDTALIALMGKCLTGGIVLGMKNETDALSVLNEVERQKDGLHAADMDEVYGRFAAVLVPQGIEFYQNEMSQNTPKVQGWMAEFNLLQSSES